MSQRHACSTMALARANTVGKSVQVPPLVATGATGAGFWVVMAAVEVVLEPATGTFVALNAEVNVVSGKGVPAESGRT
jgi:hypothetical protein